MEPVQFAQIGMSAFSLYKFFQSKKLKKKKHQDAGMPAADKKDIDK